MGLKTLFAAMAVFSFLFLFGCVQDTGSLTKQRCESTGGTVIPAIGADFLSCECPEGKQFYPNYGCELPLKRRCESTLGIYDPSTGCQCGKERAFDSMESGCESISLINFKQLCKNSGGKYIITQVRREICPAHDTSCTTGKPDCRCPTGKPFDSKYGCMDEQSQKAAQLCDSSGGRYNYCTVEACISSCICNPGETFDSTLGCIALTPEFPQELLACKSLCENTGGIFCSNYSDAKCTTIELLPGCACPDASTAGCGVFIGQGGCNNTG